MKKIPFAILCMAFGINAMAQTTVTFKPNAAIGQDATIIAFDGDCIPSGETTTPADLNYGTDENIIYDDWTYSSNGCNGGTTRSLLKFSQLNTIPSNAIVTNVELRLYGVPSSPNPQGNTGYTGSPYDTTNEGWLKRVTSNWNESTVTWNTQPGTTTTGEIAIPRTTTQWNWDWFVNSTSEPDLLNIVQGWVTNPTTNFGFLLQLQTEVNYRCTIFASSDHTNSALWPELIVTYELCDANFTYTFNTANPYQVTFDAAAAGTTGLTFQWNINGSTFSGSSATYTFPGSGSYSVCLTVYDQGKECNKNCIRLCMDEMGGAVVKRVENDEEIDNNAVPKGHVIPGDQYPFNKVVIAPNPSKDGWNVNVRSIFEGKATISLYDMMGKQLSSHYISLQKGANSFYQDAQKQAPGIYIIQIKDANGNMIANEKVTKQ